MKSLLRKVLSPSTLVKLKNIVSDLDSKIYPTFSKHPFLSSIYYCFFSTQFRREHHAVLQGRLRYTKSLKTIEQSSILLRRNTHRLEKGLIMQPRREVFAEAYIGETIDCFQKCLQSTEMCKDELKWAQDVLVKYFEVVGSSSVLDRARSQFEQLTLMSFDLDADSLPYQHNQRVKSPITQQQLESLFKQRRSVRWYENKPVELDKLQQAIEMASQAPSACNRQPFQFYTTVDQSKAAELSSIAMGTTGFADNIPALIVVVGDLSSYPAERDRHVIYIDGGLASMQLMLAVETIGLSSCPINWPDIEVCEVKLAKKLNLPAHLRPIMMIAIGYAQSEGQIPYSQKKSAQLLLKEIH